MLLVALIPVPIWVIFLTVANPVGVTWEDNLAFLLSEDHELNPWFYASIISGVLSLVVAATYLSKLSQSKIILLVLLVFCMLQAVTAIIFLSWDLNIIYSLPVVFGFLAYKNPNKSFKIDGAKNRAAI